VAEAQGGVRRALEPGVSAALRDGRILFLEAQLPPGNAAKELLSKYLASAEDWRLYRDRAAVAIPFSKLNPKAQRAALEALFPQDYVDAVGWWHTVTYEGSSGTESLMLLAEWLAGSPGYEHEIQAAEGRCPPTEPLKKGQRLLVPISLLPSAMKTPTPRPAPSEPLEPAEPEKSTEPVEAADLAESAEPAKSAEKADDGKDAPISPEQSGLRYGSDGEGKYAEYRMRKGETIYSGVVGRFTDYNGHVEVQGACEVIQRRSGIRDERKVGEGRRIRIPLEMLSDRYQPQGTEERREYDEVQAETQRLSGDKSRTKDLEGVAVILDPGHGGRDNGATPTAGVYEYAVSYDIACRIKSLLETKTRAKVFMTMKDMNHGFAISNARSFGEDGNKVVLTTPPYQNESASMSANLRWYLANDIFRRERAAGVGERNVLFTSIHCDALHREMRGTMVYVPGAAHRRESETPNGHDYSRYAEAREARASSCSDGQARRDEAMSRVFAQTLVKALRAHKPAVRVHNSGDPVRNVIRQRGGKAYVPTVLRNNCVPTKVLIETANMNNAEDRANLADPQWRQAFAEGFIDALRRHYGSCPPYCE
jgi:N-acetylmuramoyl-L-alanine amidase